MKISLSIVCLLVYTGACIGQCPIINTTSITNVTCFGGNDGTATANPSGGTLPYTFLWMPGGQTTQTAVGLSAWITYTLTINDATPCTPLVESVIVSEPPNPYGIIDGSATVCHGVNSGTLSLVGYSGAVLNWMFSTNGGATWTNIPNTSATQNYTNLNATREYAAIVQNGVCGSDTSSIATILVTPNSVGGNISGSTTVCSGANTGTHTLSGNTGSIISWESSSDGGFTWYSIGNTQNTQTYNNLVITTAFRAVIQNGVCASTFSDTAIVTVSPPSNGGTTAGAATVCSGANGGTITLSGFTGNILNWASSTDGGITWVNIVDTTTSLVYSNLDSTTSYSAIVQSGVCSTDTSSITVITVNPTPVAGFSVADVCIGQTSVFVNSSTVSTGLLQFIIWNFGDSTSSVATNPIHLYALAGTYPTTLKVISDMGCVSTITNNAIVNPLPNPTITPSGPTSFCFGGNVTLSGENGLTYSWSTSDTTQSIVVSTSGTYHLTVTNPTTSCVNSDSIVVEVFPLPVAYPGNDTIISLGFSYTLNAQQGVIFSWLPATGLSNSNIYNPIAEPLVTTTYLLTVTDDNGCSNSSSLLIKVRNDYLFNASNALTPNGDGLNDLWNIQNIENYPDNSLAVFNRYGQEVYTASPYKNDWGGTYNGELLPDGTYYYVLKFTGSEKIFKGGVTIISGGN